VVVGDDTGPSFLLMCFVCALRPFSPPARQVSELGDRFCGALRPP
jgi:hypothetical protein